MAIQITRSGQALGAAIRGVDLARPLAGDDTAAIRAAWLAHQVIYFPDQALTIADLERVSRAFGPFGEDPFIAPIPGHPHVIAVKREANETTPLFAEVWHSDWSFRATPPAGTLLYGVEIPPQGGDTLFADQYGAYEALPEATKARIAPLRGVHSAARGYSKEGLYGERDKGRSMTIRPSDDALATQAHPIVRTHAETGRKALFVNMGYSRASRAFHTMRRGRCSWSSFSISSGMSSSTATAGRRAWRRCGTIAASRTRPPAAMKASGANSGAPRSMSRSPWRQPRPAPASSE